MKKIMLLMLFLSTVIYAACSQTEEDNQEYLGYEFTLMKEQKVFS